MAWLSVHGDSSSITSMDVNPDLAKERESPPFPVETLTNILDGGHANTLVRREVETLVHGDPVFSRENIYFQTLEERYEGAIQKTLHFKKKMVQMGWTDDGPQKIILYRILGGEVAFNVHGVFVNSILGLGTDEQIAKWIPLAQNYQIIGSYAQTELGHGTYLRGLETTATFNVESQEFILNTPKTSATKWWPGDMGRSATHAVVLAQLYIKGKAYGMHPFIIQIRSLVDHSPLPGIVVGDIGPKMSFEHIDNGYLLMRNIRVPKENMLSRYSQVLPDGSYVKQGSEKINYFTMILVRVSMLANEVAPALAKASVISIRYSAVRRQSELKPGDPEVQILDYQTQQQKVLPQLATSYAIHFVSAYLGYFYSEVYNKIKVGNFDSLPELHALAAGLKALVTDYCTAGIEVCRRACGGHGYSLLSGLPSLYTKLAASCTYEGENTVLYLQTARFLVKCFAAAQSHQALPESVIYLSSASTNKCRAQTNSDFLNPAIYLEAYEHRAYRHIQNAAHQLQALVQAGAEQYDAWNSTSVQLVQASMAHCHFTTVRVFVDEVKRLGNEPSVQAAIKPLCDLFALHGIFTNAGGFLHDGYLSGQQLDMATASYLDLLAVVRKTAVLLTDAFDFTDEQLNSALGRFDGQVYQRLFEWAQKAPANNKVNPVYEKYLRPLFQSTASKL
ncbi:peroxisomal acyl-coenzyme A oxidase 2 [Ambystoma mexicanum]|uniref:peroxisomal acyl-coenzyme A oxidase 2 n=1 Tax=Ambystoma mexicanum TaxID=8296 RepID=UPI0037E967D9